LVGAVLLHLIHQKMPIILFCWL